jgi:hypothetical protein
MDAKFASTDQLLRQQKEKSSGKTRRSAVWADLIKQFTNSSQKWTIIMRN